MSTTYDVNNLHNDTKSLLNKIVGRVLKTKPPSLSVTKERISELMEDQVPKLLRAMCGDAFGEVTVVTYALTDEDNTHEGWGVSIVVLDKENFGRLYGTTVFDWNKLR
jgi:hypothetical protein